MQISKNNVNSASVDVLSLIMSSRLQLIGVSIFSVLITLGVFWFLVTRNILARLLQTIAALRSIADGDYDVSVDIGGKDELSDLAKTVDVFRQRALDALSFQKQKDELAEKQKEEQIKREELEASARNEEKIRHNQEREMRLSRNKLLRIYNTA